MTLSLLAYLRALAEYLGETDPELVEGGCADLSLICARAAELRGESVQVISGRSARKGRKGFGHVWLDINGQRFDPVAWARDLPLVTYEPVAGRSLELESSPYTDEPEGADYMIRAFDLAATKIKPGAMLDLDGYTVTVVRGGIVNDHASVWVEGPSYKAYMPLGIAAASVAWA